LRFAVTELSQAGVDHLKKMKRLHTLHFVDATDIMDNIIPNYMIAVAGEVPSLRKLNSVICGRNHNQFIEELAEKYPQKQLLIKRLT
jgi:hypothetical protein